MYLSITKEKEMTKIKSTNINEVGKQLANMFGDTEANYGKEPRLTFDELQELENLFSDIRHARDQLESRGYNVGGYTLNSITDAQRNMLPNEEEVIK